MQRIALAAAVLVLILLIASGSTIRNSIMTTPNQNAQPNNAGGGVSGQQGTTTTLTITPATGTEQWPAINTQITLNLKGNNLPPPLLGQTPTQYQLYRAIRAQKNGALSSAVSIGGAGTAQTQFNFDVNVNVSNAYEVQWHINAQFPDGTVALSNYVSVFPGRRITSVQYTPATIRRPLGQSFTPSTGATASVRVLGNVSESSPSATVYNYQRRTGTTTWTTIADYAGRTTSGSEVFRAVATQTVPLFGRGSRANIINSLPITVTWVNPSARLVGSTRRGWNQSNTLALTIRQNIPTSRFQYRYEWRASSSGSWNALTNGAYTTYSNHTVNAPGQSFGRSYEFSCALVYRGSTVARTNIIRCTWGNWPDVYAGINRSITAGSSSSIVLRPTVTPTTPSGTGTRWYYQWRERAQNGSWGNWSIRQSTSTYSTGNKTTAQVREYQVRIFTTLTSTSVIDTDSVLVTWTAAPARPTSVSITRLPTGNLFVNASVTLTATPNATIPSTWRYRFQIRDSASDTTPTSLGTGRQTSTTISYSKASAGSRQFRVQLWNATTGGTPINSSWITVTWVNRPVTPPPPTTTPSVTISASHTSRTAGQNSILTASPSNIPSGTTVYYQFQSRVSTTGSWTNLDSRQTRRTKVVTSTTATTLQFRVRMYNASTGGSTVGNPSSSVSITWSASGITESASISASPGSPNETQSVTLTATLTGAVASGYSFQEGTTASGPWTRLANTTLQQRSRTASVPAQTNGTTKYFRVICYWSAGNKSVTSAAITVSWGPQPAAPGTSSLDCHITQRFSTQGFGKRSSGWPTRNTFTTTRSFQYSDLVTIANPGDETPNRTQSWVFEGRFQFGEDDLDSSDPEPSGTIGIVNESGWGLSEDEDNSYILSAILRKPDTPPDSRPTQDQYRATLRTDRKGVIHRCTINVNWYAPLEWQGGEQTFRHNAGEYIDDELVGAKGGVPPYTYALAGGNAIGPTHTRTTGNSANGSNPFGRIRGVLSANIFGTYVWYKTCTDAIGQKIYQWAEMHVRPTTGPTAFLAATSNALPTGSSVTLTASSVNAPSGFRYQFQRKTPSASAWTNIGSATTSTTITRTDTGTMEYRVRLLSSTGTLLDNSNIQTVSWFTYDVTLSYPTQGGLRQDYVISATTDANAPEGYLYRFQRQYRGRFPGTEITTNSWRTMPGGDRIYTRSPLAFRTTTPQRNKFRVQLLSASGTVLATDTSNTVTFRG